jgi:hypothetical protein
MFAYRSRPTDEPERRIVFVMCERCGMLFEEFEAEIDNEGNAIGEISR